MRSPRTFSQGRRLAFSILAVLGALAPMVVSAQPAGAPPDPKLARTVLKPSLNAKVEVRTVMYRGADGVELPADIYFNPDVKGLQPTLLLISGTDDSRDWGGYRDFGRLAAERGFVGIVPAKRFPRGGAGIAQGRSDTAALLDQLTKSAPDLIDRARVGLWAFSAGGTTLSIAYAKERPELSCVIGFYPAVSIAVSAPEEWLATYSPAHALGLHGGPSSPPTLIVRAGKDSETLNSGIADFTARALSRNAPLTVINLPEARHGFDLFDDTDWSREAIENAFDFAERATRRNAASAAERSAKNYQDVAELSERFKAHGLTGTFVLFDSVSDTMFVANEKRAQERFTPASTFKIANSLIGLDAGAVKSVDEVLPYGGKPQRLKQWEQDMNLRDAIKVSNVPVYQELARRIGLERMRAGVKKLGYGNMEIGDVVDQFWLDGPLAISALEQTEFLDRVVAGKLPVNGEAVRAVKEITLVEKTDAYELHGKTGWVVDGKREIGWWVGWIERDGKTYPFALNIDMPRDEDAAKRIPLGRECLKVLGKL